MADKPPPPRYLPGDPRPEERLAEMVRVDQAGEYGAKRIYAGQLAVLGHHHRLGPVIRHMAAQEERHLEIFDRLVVERRVRPSALAPFWHVSGYALGALTALLGERAALACTAAVEEVIDGHYEEQRAELARLDPALADTVAECQADEAEHRETALRLGAAEMPGYDLLAGAIRAGCRLAIAIAKKI